LDDSVGRLRAGTLGANVLACRFAIGPIVRA
jgi:hypothetical protein